jgi:hypothetical protein
MFCEYCSLVSIILEYWSHFNLFPKYFFEKEVCAPWFSVRIWKKYQFPTTSMVIWNLKFWLWRIEVAIEQPLKKYHITIGRCSFLLSFNHTSYHYWWCWYSWNLRTSKNLFYRVLNSENVDLSICYRTLSLVLVWNTSKIIAGDTKTKYWEIW